MEATAVFFLLVLPAALAGPVDWLSDSSSCASRCSGADKFSYQTGRKYEYRYVAETRTTMAGATDVTATIHIEGTALIEVLDSCEMALKLVDVKISRSQGDGTDSMADVPLSPSRRSLEKYPLRFAFYDGAVGELCPDEQEDVWSLNIKRGVLTAFQNSMQVLDRDEQTEETDITGRCPTMYKVTQKGYETLTVTKVKDILSCRDRQSARTSVLSTPFYSPNAIQSLPLMKTSYECRHSISSAGRMVTSSCQEVHVFRPFSKGANGAVTEASQKLTFQRDTSGVSTHKGPVNKKTTLLFEHKHGLRVAESSIDGVRTKLEEICSATADDIRPEVPRLFGEMVYLLRDLSYSDLKDLDRQLQRKKICSTGPDRARKFFLDALPMTGTAGSVSLMAEILRTDEVKEGQETLWLTSLAFLPNPALDVVNAAQVLVSDKKLKLKALLPVSALVNNYCDNNPGCQDQSAVVQLMASLTGTIGYDCRVNDDNLKEVLLTLRAIGNIGRAETWALHLEPCFTKSSAPMDVRVASLEAYRRLPCSTDRNNVLQTFLRASEDSELRIAAYLTAMQCPTENVVQQVRDVLLNEEVNQVGSFVWTHLTNLLETSSPLKQAIRDILENEILQREFSMDRRKYSRNYEVSFFNEKFNLGGVYDSNVIWSPSSFVPRSAMMNLTVDLFGQSVNLLEVGGRVQGLQYLLDSYLGPKSRDTGNEGGYGVSKEVKEEKLARVKSTYGGDVKEDLRAQMYLRVFGNELAYSMMDSSDLERVRGRSGKSYLDDLLQRLAKNEQLAFTHSATFLDSTLVIPTTVGLPLNLTLNGSASVALKASGKLDIGKINDRQRAFEISANLQPSAAVEIAATMSVDAFLTEVGLKMTSRLHTSTAFQGRMELARGQVLTLTFDLPRDQQEIIAFESKFFMVHDSNEREQRLLAADNPRKEGLCTSQSVAEVAGIELCATATFPNSGRVPDAPYCPFAGPMSVAVMLRKHDLPSGYRLLAKQIQTNFSSMAEIALETPSAKTDRATSLSYTLSFKEKTLEVDLLSPWKRANLKLALEETKELINATGEVTLMTDQKYSVVLQLVKELREKKNEASAKLAPTLIVTSPEGRLLFLAGNVDYKQNKHVKGGLELEIKDLLKKPIGSNFSLTMRDRKGKMRYQVDFKLTSQYATLKSSTHISTDVGPSKKRGALVTARAVVDYTLLALPGLPRDQLRLSLKVHDRTTASLQKYSFNMNMDSKSYPDANILVSGEGSYKSSLTKAEVKVRHGKNVKLLKDQSKEMVITASVSHKVKESEAGVVVAVQASYPDKDIDYHLNGKHEHDKQSAEQYLTVRYGKGKSVIYHSRLVHTQKQRNITVDLSYPGRDIKLNGDLTLKDEASTNYILSALVQPQKGEKNSVVVSFKRPADNSIEMVGDMSLHQIGNGKLDVSGNYALRGMRGKGLVLWDSRNYSVEYTSDIQRGRYGKWTVDLGCPERRITGRAEGGIDRAKATKRASMEVLWDADNNPSQKIGATVEMADRLQADEVNIGGLVEVFTPLSDYEHLKVQLQFENSSRRIACVAELVPGRDDDQFSVKFDLPLPISKNRFALTMWLKTPIEPIRVLALAASHSFDESGRLEESLRGDFNVHFLEVKLGGASKGDLVQRKYDGGISFASSISEAGNYKLTFNYYDNGIRYMGQTLLDANGDQYSMNMEASLTKVHVQISTDGSVTVRIPQRAWPITLSWKHKNSLHELNTTLTATVSPAGTAKLNVGGKYNAVTKKFECDVALSGPWGQGMTDHVTELHFSQEQGNDMMKMSVSLSLNADHYSLSDENEWSETAFTRRTSLSLSNPPMQVQTFVKVQHGKFPLSVTANAQVGGNSILELSGDVRREDDEKFNSQVTFILRLENEIHTVSARASHEKEGSLWVTDGSATYNKRRTIKFRTRMDLGEFRIMWLSVDSPFEEAKTITASYSHTGALESQFTGLYTLMVLPHFNTISTEIVLSNNDIVSGRVRVDTPFEEFRYVEASCSSRLEDGKRRSTVEVDYHPKQTYKIDTTYVVDFPNDVAVTLNLTTPLQELPSLFTELEFKYTDDDVSGKLRMIGPSTNFEEFATSFGHRRDGTSLSTNVDAAVPSLRRMSGKVDFNWENEIDGTISIDSTGQGHEPTQFILSHRGHTWDDFRTKVGFRMNGDRLETEVAYSNKDGKQGLFILATPDPDISYLKTTFLHRLSETDYEGRWTVQYGENTIPYEAGVKSVYSNDKLAFGVDLKTPHSKDFVLDLGFSGGKKIETKLSCVYGRDKVESLLKYKILENSWDVGGEFEYRIQGKGQDIGLTFTREGPPTDLNVRSSGKYMGNKVLVDIHYKDVGKKIGDVGVRTTFENFKDLAASFEHTGSTEQFATKGTLRYMDGKEAQGSVEFQRREWKRTNLTAVLKLPVEDYEENKLTYEHNRRKNALSASAVLTLGSGNPINAEVLFQGDSKLHLTVKGPFKDFRSFEAKGQFDNKSMTFDGNSTLILDSQKNPLTATYLVKAENWPVMVNVKVQTPFQDWENTELTLTHDGDHSTFTTICSLKALAVGTVISEAYWMLNSESSFEGMWTLTSALKGAENLKLAVKNLNAQGEYRSHVQVGWALLKAVELDGSLAMGSENRKNAYAGSLSMTTPYDSVPQVGFSFNHAHDDSMVKDTTVATYNNRRYFDADFEYVTGDRREGRLEIREPRSMEFLVGGRYKAKDMDGEVKLNWDKTSPEMNVHLTGRYKDLTDDQGTDKELKLVAIHPARTMGIEYVLKQAEKEFQTDLMLTWDREAGRTLAYDLRYNDHSSRYTSSYDVGMKVVVPMRSVQVEGAYSDTGRMKNARTAVMWDADRDKNMKVGMNGGYEVRGEANKVQVGVELPFIGKEYSLMTQATVNSGNTILDARTEFSYSSDPGQVVILTTRFDDISFGLDTTTNYSLSLGLSHPVTNVDIQMTSHVGHSEALGSMATKVIYMTADKQRKNLELRGQIDKFKKNMILELKSPLKNIALEGEAVSNGNYNVSVITREDDRRHQVTSLFVNPESKTMDFVFYYDKDAPENSVKISGYLVSGRMLQTEVSRTADGQRVSETLLTVRLNSSHVLHTRVNWRPSMLPELQQYVSTQLTILSYSASEAFKAAAQSVGQEVQAKYQAVMEEAREEMQPVLKHLQAEIESAQKQLSTMQRDMRRFYLTNALHVRDLGEIANQTFEQFFESFRSFTESYEAFYSNAQQQIRGALQELSRYPMAQKYAELVENFAAGLLNTRALLEGALGELSKQVTELSEATYRQYLIVSRQIERKLQGYTAAIQQATQFNGFGSVFNSRVLLGSYENYRQLSEAANEKMLAALDKLGLKDMYVDLVTKGKQLLADQYSDIVQRPEYQQIYMIGNEIYQQSVWAYQYWQVENNARMAVAQLLQLLKEVTLLEITRIKNAIVDIDKSRVIVFDPQHGEMQFEIHLPVPLKSLVEPPDVRLTKYINRVKSWVATYVPTQRHSLWTSINSYVPFMDSTTWLPPYKAYGYVIGDQHLVTFDQTQYNFAGRCSYILSRDMVDDRFTVVVNYNNRPRQPQIESVIVLLRGVAIEVGVDQKVKINDQERDLPFFSGSVSAVRDQGVVRVRDGEDLVVEMDAARGIYSIGVSGWYHGRTAGLLGTYDNERFNDLTDASRQISHAVEEFANTWEVSRILCRSRNVAGNDIVDLSLPEVQACSAHLNSSSSYYTPCFAQLPSEQAVRACVEYVRAGLQQARAQCRAGEQYRYMCRRRGVVIGTPTECVTCAFPDGKEVAAGSSEEVQGGEGQRSADVVFVVEESDCNDWARTGLSRMASSLDVALSRQGLQKNRFGLVSYYGNGSRDDPFIHTIQGQMFGDSSNFLKAAETLRLTSPGGSGSPAGPLRSAMMYPYRVAVAKVLVLAPCSACSSDMRDLASVLQSHGFVLHVLQKEALMLAESSNNSPVKAFGTDKYTVMTRKSGSRGQSSVAQQVQLPQDACVSLALAANGSVFDVTHMRDRERIQRDFLESFAARLASTAGPPPCQVCSCHDDGTGGGRTLCRVCQDSSQHDDRIPLWLQSSTTSLMSIINDLRHRVVTALLVPAPDSVSSE